MLLQWREQFIGLTLSVFLCLSETYLDAWALASGCIHFQETKHAKNQNKPFCCETIQTNGNREICFLEISWQSYFDKKNDQTQTIFEKKPDYR